MRIRFSLWILTTAGFCCGPAVQAMPAEAPGSAPSTNEPARAITLERARASTWQGEMGEGFAPGVSHCGVVAGAGLGMEVFGSSSTHNLALAGVSYGKVCSGVQAADKFYRGNWEWRLELLGGSQFHPNAAYLVGLTPHLRYNLATGTRWVPFVDIGVGVTATDIGEPDLGGVFQFNLQGAAGVNYFLREHLALGAELRLLHLSSARINTPNLGVNTCLALLGMNWYF
jgi:lipid A 3-O-deacylase